MNLGDIFSFKRGKGKRRTEFDLMEDMAKVQEETLQSLKERQQPPYLFSADCDKCGKPTVQVSHIAYNDPLMPPSIAGFVPLRTCLVCGLTIYQDRGRGN